MPKSRNRRRDKRKRHYEKLRKIHAIKNEKIVKATLEQMTKKVQSELKDKNESTDNSNGLADSK